MKKPPASPDDTDPSQQPASPGACRRRDLWRHATQAVPGKGKRRAQDHFNKPVQHDGRTELATWHPSYALRAPDPAAREHAYLDIVTALKHARRIAAGK